MARPTSFARSLTNARRHLSRNDPVLAKLMAAIGPCTLKPGGESFALLVRGIVSQMISTQAARSVYARLEALLPKGVTPAAVVDIEPEKLRAAGLSSTKVGAICDLAARVHAGDLDLDSLQHQDEDRAIEQLTAIRGIGPWTAHMYLMFGLGRLNVLPVADLGLRAAVQEHYALATLPSVRELRQVAEPWHPYCTVATWYMWRSRGAVPQSK